MTRSVLILAMILAIAAAAYSPGLKGDFVWDDRPLILKDTQIRSFSNFGKLFFRDFFAPGEDDSKYGYYRPLVSLSYMLDWRLWGENPMGYRLSNLFWHGLSTILLYLLLTSLWPRRTGTGLALAALFALHPVHTESVSWISGRTDLICAAFALASLICWVRYRKTPSPPAPATKGLGLLILCYVFFLLSLSAKEMGVIVPAVALVLAPALGKEDSSRGLRGLFPPALGFLAVLLFYMVMRSLVAGVTVAEPSREHSLAGALATFPSAFSYYLFKLLIPIKLSAYIVWPYQSFPRGFHGVAGILLLAGFVFIILKTRKTAPAFSACALAFLVGFLPLSNLVRISAPSDMGFVIAERFLYLPSALACLLIAAALDAVDWEKRTRAKPLALLLVAALTLLFGLRTGYAARVWSDEGKVYENALAQYPDAPLIWANLGSHYRRQGRINDALEALETAQRINERLHSADPLAIYNNLGTALASAGRLEEALQYFDKALRAGGQEDQVQLNRGEALRILGRLDEALSAYNASLDSNPREINAALRRAQIRMIRDDADGARADLEMILKIDPGHPDALANLGMLHRRQGRLDEAATLLRRSLRRKADNLNAWMALGGVEGQRRRFPEAAWAFQNALRLEPDSTRPMVALSAALFRSGEKMEAKKILDRGLDKNPEDIEVLIHLAHWHYETGDMGKLRELLQRAKSIAPDHPQVKRYSTVLEGLP